MKKLFNAWKVCWLDQDSELLETDLGSSTQALLAFGLKVILIILGTCPVSEVHAIEHLDEDPLFIAPSSLGAGAKPCSGLLSVATLDARLIPTPYVPIPCALYWMEIDRLGNLVVIDNSGTILRYTSSNRLFTVVGQTTGAYCPEVQFLAINSASDVLYSDRNWPPAIQRLTRDGKTNVFLSLDYTQVLRSDRVGLIEPCRAAIASDDTVFFTAFYNSRDLGQSLGGIFRVSTNGDLSLISSRNRLNDAESVMTTDAVGQIIFSSFDPTQEAMSLNWLKPNGTLAGFPLPKPVFFPYALVAHPSGYLYATARSDPLLRRISADGRVEIVATNLYNAAILAVRRKVNERPMILVDGERVVPGPASSAKPVSISMTSSLTNATILYSLDGSEPGFSSLLYSGPFTMRKSARVRAVAFDENFQQRFESPPLDIQIVSVSLTTSSTGGGVVAREPMEEGYLPGTSVELRAVPEPGWVFLRWLGDVGDTNNPTRITLTRDACVQAEFGTSFTTASVGSGTVAAIPQPGILPFGTKIRATAKPAADHYLAFWGSPANSTNVVLDYTLNRPSLKLTGVFQPLSQTQVSLSVEIEGRGSLLPSALGSRYTIHSRLLLEAVPDPGQVFLGWRGDLSGSERNQPLILDRSKAVKAIFTRAPVLSISGCGEGTSGGRFRAQVGGAYGVAYAVSQSHDLRAWTPIGIFTNSFGHFQFDVPISNENQRSFFRVDEN